MHSHLPDLEEDTLKDNLIEGIHYDHIPKPLWERLISRYGLSQGSRTIERYANNYNYVCGDVSFSYICALHMVDHMLC